MSTLEFPAPLDRETLKETSKPVRKETAPKTTAQRGGPRQAPLQARLQEAIGGLGLLVVMVNEIDGLAIIQGAERLSISLDKAAKQNPSVRRTLEKALTGGVWAEVVFSVGAIAVPIALNHGLLPGSLLGHFAIPTTGEPSSNGNQSASPESE